MSEREIVTLDEAIDGLAAAAVFLAKLPMSAKARASLAAVDRAIDYLQAQHEARERRADELQSALTAAAQTAYNSGLALAAGGDDAARLLACQNKQLVTENLRLRQQLRAEAVNE